MAELEARRGKKERITNNLITKSKCVYLSIMRIVSFDMYLLDLLDVSTYYTILAFTLEAIKFVADTGAHCHT